MQQNQTENKTNNNNTKVFKELEDSSSFASKINEMFLLQKKLNDNTNTNPKTRTKAETPQKKSMSKGIGDIVKKYKLLTRKK